MKGAALSDLHLGFRGSGRTVNGRNQRELDVEAAWERAVDIIVEAQPDLVTIAGDVFHSVRPNFHAVLAWQRGIRRLVNDTRAYIVVIQGNHEGPKTSDTACPNLVVDGLPRVSVVGEPVMLRHTAGGWDDEESIAIHCLPFVGIGGGQVYSVEPDPDAAVNILLVHAAVKSSARPGALPSMYGGATALDVSRADGFDVVACGDYHEFTLLAPSFGSEFVTDSGTRQPSSFGWEEEDGPLAFYSGSIERTSSNIWQETQPKGVVLYDTTARTMEFEEIPTRLCFDSLLEYPGNAILSPDAEIVNLGLARLLEEDSLADSLLRLRVDDFPRGERESIDWKLVAALKERCVLFNLDLRYADRDVQDLGDRRERGARTLGDDAEAFFAEDEEAVRETALEYLGFGLIPVPF